MKVSSGILDAIRNNIESIEFGRVIVNVNTEGKFIEIVTEHRQRFTKEGDLDKLEGLRTVYRTDC